MKRKQPDSDTIRNDPASDYDEAFVDERQVRAFADSLVEGTRVDGSASSPGLGPKAPSNPSNTRPSPEYDPARGVTAGSEPQPSEPDSLWQLLRHGSSLPNTLPSLTDADQQAARLSECLPEDAILAFVEGRLQRAELVQAHRHLDACEACQILVAEAAHFVSGGSYESSSDGEPMAVNLVSGTVLDERYRIQRFIARGGMGEVYEAYDRVLQERIALKTVTATVCDNPKAVRRLMAEVQLARRVSHPNVCRIYDLGSHSDAGVVHFLTMEYVNGESLAKRLAREGFLRIEEAVSVAVQLLKGLDAAHAAGILHRDFKTDNVMLSPTANGHARAVIMDFGLARALDADPGRLTTGANQPLVGTLSYMAPEQVEGAELSVRTDIYAFGIVLYEMLTGHLPFAADSPAATALRRLHDRPKRPSHHTPDLPAKLDAVVLTCLSREPARRYGSASEVLKALEVVSAPERPSSAKARPGGKRLGMVVVAASAIAAVWALSAVDSQRDATGTSRSGGAEAREPGGKRLQAAMAQSEPTPSAKAIAREQAHAVLEPPEPRPTVPSVPSRMRAASTSTRPSARTSLRLQSPAPDPQASSETLQSPPAAEPQAAAGSRDDALIVPEIFQQRPSAPGAAAPSTSAPPPSVLRSPPSPSDTGG